MKIEIVHTWGIAHRFYSRIHTVIQQNHSSLSKLLHVVPGNEFEFHPSSIVSHSI